MRARCAAPDCPTHELDGQIINRVGRPEYVHYTACDGVGHGVGMSAGAFKFLNDTGELIEQPS